MTREEARKAAEVMMAYAEGKEVEFTCGPEGDCIWNKTEEPIFSWSSFRYRVKPEPKYRPFKNSEECWQEMLKHQPFGWLKSKMNGRFSCIGEVYGSDELETVYIALSTSESLSRSSDSMFEQYTFADGTPFGIKEE